MKFSLLVFVCAMDEMQKKKSYVFYAIYVIVSYKRPFFQKQILFLCFTNLNFYCLNLVIVKLIHMELLFTINTFHNLK
jgi:hypothetical protein